MITVETIGKVRRAYWVQGKKIRAIAREMNLARDTVRRIVRGGGTERVYERREQPLPKLGAFREKLDAALDDNEKKPRRQRLTAKRIYEALRAEGYVGGYDVVRRYWQRWRAAHASATAVAFVCDNMKTAVDAIYYGQEARNAEGVPIFTISHAINGVVLW